MIKQDSFIIGLVLKSLGKTYEVILDHTDEIVTATLRGKMRLDNSKSTNPVTVGDYVVLEKSIEEYIISEIKPRKNHILRKSVNLSKQTHVIAANIDQLFLLVTLKKPQTSYGFIDRVLLTASSFKIPVVIVLNKMDLYDQTYTEEIEYFNACYTTLGYKIIENSMNDENGYKEIKDLCINRTSLFTGHSGVGKTTLINMLDNSLNLKTASVSDHHGKGQHTTTHAQMYQWEFGGYLVDTPGIKGFGVTHIEKNEINHYFNEFLEFKTNCKFYDCKHINEPKCAVKKGLDEGDIFPTRYNSYLSLMEDDEEQYRKVKY